MSSVAALDWSALLLASSEEVLETMFFISILGVSSGPLLGEAISASLRFEGIPSGSFTINLSTGSASEMAATFLGVEAELVTNDQLDQVVGELANMICGNALSRAALGKTLNLTHPEIARASSSAHFNASRSIGLEIENGFLEIFLDFDTNSAR